MSDKGLFLAQLHFQSVPDKIREFCLNSLAFLSCPIDCNQKVICIANIFQSLIGTRFCRCPKQLLCQLLVLSNQLLPHCSFSFLDFLMQCISLVSYRVVFFRKVSRIVSVVKFLLQLRDIPVQFVQVDIRKNRGNDSTLRTSAIGFMEIPVFHIARFQKHTNQVQKASILDFSVQHTNQRGMVDVIETSLDVALNEPLCSGKLMLDHGKCRVAASARSKAVGIDRENWLVDGFQNHTDSFLHQLVSEYRKSQRAQLAVLLLNIGSAYRLGFI